MLYCAQSHRMPRKLYRNVDSEPSLETPPGAGEPQSAKEKARARLDRVKRNVAEQRRKTKEDMERRKREPVVAVSEMNEDEATALAHELDADFEAASDRFIAAEDTLRAEPTIENAKAVEVAREEAQELHDASEEALPKSGKRRKSKATVEREAREAGHQANVNELISDYVEEERGKHSARVGKMREQVAEMEASMLAEEKADNLKRMQEMGGVWGGESYFVLSERNEEIDAKLNKLRRVSPEKKVAASAEVVPATEEALVSGELTPEDRVADARKSIDFMNAYEQEIAARQKVVRAELKKHGIKDAAQIDDVLSEMSPELRERSIGLDPGIWYKIRKMARNLAGMERPPEVKELLQKYAELENEMNEQLHKRREAEAELAAAHAAAGSTPSRRTISRAHMRSLERRALGGSQGGVGVDMSPVMNALPGTPNQMHVAQELESLKMIEQGSLQKELAAVRAMKMMEEEIQDAMLNITRRRDNEIDLGDAQLYKDKFEGLYQRVRALKDELGDSKEGDEALHNAEAALAKYNELIDRRLSSQRALSEQFSQSVRAADEQSKREREAGRAQPMSVIGQRGGEYGSYGASKADRRTVRLGKQETSDSFERRKAQELREAEELREKVNKEVQNYRSIKWRKELIDSINQNEDVRAAMHSLYDSFKARASELQNAGADLGQLQTSPDPALDYALNLYRLHATKKDGGYVYGDQLRDAAAGALIEAEEALGKEWDANGHEQRFKAALVREKTTGSALETATEIDVEVEAPVQGVAGVPSELVASLPPEMRTEAKAIAFAYRTLNRDERGSFTKPWVVKQIMRRMESPDESKAERLYEAFLPQQETESAPLAHLKRSMSEHEQEEIELNEADLEEIPQMKTLSLEEMAARLRRADAAQLSEAKKIVGLLGRKIKAENIANQYGVLAGLASNGSSMAAERLQKIHKLLDITFDEATPLADSDIEVIEGPPLAEVIDLAKVRAAKNKKKSA